MTAIIKPDMAEINFSIKLKIRIDWSEIDILGHVNNVSIFKYIQASRVKCLEKSGITKMYERSKKGAILASCKCDFKTPLYYPGHITIQSKIDLVKNTSFSIFYQIIDDNNQIAAEARDIIVMFDFNENTKIKIPDKIRSLISKQII